MVVDNGPILEDDRRCYEALRRDLENSEHRLETFDTVDIPGFERWIGIQFGRRLNGMRELELRIREKEIFLSRCRQARSRGLSAAAAYAWVKSEDERGAFGTDSRSESAADAPFDEGEADGPETDSEDDFFAFLSALGFPGLDGDGDPRAESEAREQRVKKLFRRIALRLHPDRSTEFEGPQRELWEKACAAYAARDEFELEIVLSRVDAMDGADPSRNGLAWYGEMIEECRFRLGFLADAIAAASRHAAWGFSERKPAALKRLARRIERELEEDEDDLRRRLDSLEWRIQDLERRLRRTEERKLKLKLRQPRAPDPRQSAFSFGAA
jgi:hypothetical protein